MIYDKIAMSNGVIFQHARDILFEKMQQGVINVTTGNSGSDGKAALDASLMVVVGVNTAFSCELFLKAMLPKGTKGHRLDTLFGLLDDDIQERIREITINKMRKTNPTYCSTDFQVDLADNSNIFAEWRYFHEKDGISLSLQFITHFMKAIFAIADEEREEGIS